MLNKVHTYHTSVIMKQNKTIIINCAGMGRRLGIDTPKALLNIKGQPLIIRMLELFNDFNDIRIVVGYQAKKVIETVLTYRRDVSFVFNRDFASTGPASSLSRAIDGANEYILSIDGDLILHPDDVKKIISIDGEFICGNKINSENPVLMSVEHNFVTGFSNMSGDFEWSGVCCIKKEHIKKCDGYIYNMLENLLPLRNIKIRVKDIDTINDYINAQKWIDNDYKDELIIGVLGGMGTYATINLFEDYAEMFPALKEFERPRIIIDNNCTMPSRVRAILYHENETLLVSQMNNSLNNLVRSGANKIILACNTSHLFLETIYLQNPMLKDYVENIIDDCVEEIYKQGIKEISLLASEGTIASGVYSSKLEQKGIKTIFPTNNDLSLMREFIEAVKQNKYTEDVRIKFIDYMNKFDVCLLGCTELPILYKKYKDEILTKKVFDPLIIALKRIKEQYK